MRTNYVHAVNYIWIINLGIHLTHMHAATYSEVHIRTWSPFINITKELCYIRTYYIQYTVEPLLTNPPN